MIDVSMLGNPKLAVLAVLMGGALIGGSAAFVGMQQSGISKDKAGEKVASTLEKQTGTSYEVVTVKKESGLYEVQLSANNQLQTYFVTQNGKFVSAQLTDLDQLNQRISMQSNVQTCLQNKNAVMYGNITQQATQVQVQVLGGAQAVSSYYKDVNNPGNLQEAVSRGIQSVPAIWLDNRTLSNVNNLTQVSNFANCQQ